ncbi:hypothetical protein PZ938_03045 [Luteipulveratus sp. YIM 133132]|uniref:hypothetical protein n=1 Tax=Luteipulveratus flavus TaxID=3031728 RepID=UPI0023B10D0F|nr:hypothetical protein [Luteipulveratus sp. YIM 133132]MDE9364569.1 hypothetical protein [Luteipulveratus sp. YIM 133132]
MTDRPQISTKDAAALVDVNERGFQTWAKRRGIEPVRRIRLGRTTYALWDADEVLAGTSKTPRPWRRQETDA